MTYEKTQHERMERAIAPYHFDRPGSGAQGYETPTATRDDLRASQGYSTGCPCN